MYKKVCLSLLGAGAVALLLSDGIGLARNETDEFSSGLRRLEEKKRPVMHTFYDFAKDGGVTEKGQQELIRAWEESWSAAGFDTKVLTMEDAKHHPDFDKYNEFLSKDTWGKYNTLCFWRWFAIAAVGGHWMADYDTFPLKPTFDGFDLPYDGKLTIHCPNGVPCVVSGRAFEFERIAKKIVDNAKEHEHQASTTHWSDMMALQDIIQKDPDAFENPRENGMPAERIMEDFPLDRVACEKVRVRKVMHFSHYSIDVGMEKGAIDRKLSIQDQRGAIATKIVNELADVCEEYFAKKNAEGN